MPRFSSYDEAAADSERLKTQALNFAEELHKMAVADVDRLHANDLSNAPTPAGVIAVGRTYRSRIAAAANELTRRQAEAKQAHTDRLRAAREHFDNVRPQRDGSRVMPVGGPVPTEAHNWLHHRE